MRAQAETQTDFFIFHAAVRPQKPYDLLGTGENGIGNK